MRAEKEGERRTEKESGTERWKGEREWEERGEANTDWALRS